MEWTADQLERPIHVPGRAGGELRQLLICRKNQVASQPVWFFFSVNLPQRVEKRWERQTVDGKGQAQDLPMTSPLVLLLALGGGLQVTGGGGGVRHLKKAKILILIIF